MDITRDTLLFRIDQTLLKPDVGDEELKRFCDEGRHLGFRTLIVNPNRFAKCKAWLAGSGVSLGTTAGFTMGQSTIETKVYETTQAIELGADEIDYVVNIAAVKNGDRDYLTREMKGILAACRAGGAVCKVIFETCYLTEAEKRLLCAVANDVRPDFIKTSTGLAPVSPSGATVEDVRLMRSLADSRIGVKASGGIRSLVDALAMFEAGASRIGTSAGAAILRELPQ